jgi:hypothetical protein
MPALVFSATQLPATFVANAQATRVTYVLGMVDVRMGKVTALACVIPAGHSKELAFLLVSQDPTSTEQCVRHAQDLPGWFAVVMENATMASQGTAHATAFWCVFMRLRLAVG